MWLFLFILGCIFTSVGIVGFNKGWFTGYNPPLIKKTSISIGIFLSIVGILMTSFVFVPSQHTGHLIKKYGTKLNGDRVIAINGERGRQSELLQEGLNFSPFIRVLYSISYVPYQKIEQGQLGLLTSVDGSPLGKDLFIASDWVSPDMEYKRDSIERNMLDPKYFILNGGKKGPQLNTLKPGEYKINKFMWNVDIVDATRVPDGHVGVVISRVGKVPENIELEDSGNKLATPVVDMGYMGIWKEPLKPGMYYFNTHPDKNKGAYEIKLIDTRVQTWVYKGGYDYYTIDLTITEDGKISQEKSEVKKTPVPNDAADAAIRVISEDGWDVYVDGRLLIQIQPADAPYIVASVGGVVELEDKVTTPLIRSVMRNIGEDREAPTFVWERSKIEFLVDSILKEKSDGSRLTIKEFKMNDVYIKPELLVPDKREQLAKKMEDTYKQEQKAYTEKVKTEKAREEAEQQGKLVEAKIAKQAASEFKEAEYLKGQGTKLRMLEEAKGQEALKDVLGVEKTFALEMAKTIKDYPEKAFQTPLFYIGGNSDSKDGAYSAISARNMIDVMGKIGIDPSILDESVKEYNKNRKPEPFVPSK